LTDLRHHGDTEVGPGLADFAVNVRANTPPEWLAERLRAAVADLAAYPNQAAARAAVARRHGRATDEVLLTAGAAEAFVLLARVLRPRRAVVVHPQFTEPEAALRAAGHAVDRVVLRAEPSRKDGCSGDFVFHPAAVPDDADLVLIGNPTNPTSVLHPASAITELLREGRTVVVDEAFMDCVPGEPQSLAHRKERGLVVIRSLTKTWGLAGLRAGYLLAEPAMVAALAEAQPLWSVSTPALVAIEACCEPEALLEAEEWALEMAAERDRLAGALSSCGIHVVPGAMASFLCVRVPDGLGLRALLRQRGYAVRRGDTFPGLGPDWLRIAVRGKAANDSLLEVLHDLGI
jgi:histidinol-phosphate aminotransferase